MDALEPLVGLTGLAQLHLIWNPVTDLLPAGYLFSLRRLNLARDRIVDLQALLDDGGLGDGDHVDVRENPLSTLPLAVQVPALAARGVTVLY